MSDPALKPPLQMYAVWLRSPRGPEFQSWSEPVVRGMADGGSKENLQRLLSVPKKLLPGDEVLKLGVLRRLYPLGA